jgi:hypothetical protein
MPLQLLATKWELITVASINSRGAPLQAVLEAIILWKILPQIPTSTTTCMFLLSFKDLGGRGWSEEKRAMLSVQVK